jgi:RHS repeat-associated protein
MTANLAASGQDATAGSSVTTTVAYDQSVDGPAALAGQPTKVTDPRGNAVKITYTCSKGILPCTITNALNQTAQKVYDLRWGKPTAVIEPTTAVTEMEYDGLGRVTSVYRLLDSIKWRRFVYKLGSASPPTPSRIDTKLREPNSSASYRIVASFYDSLGRPLETKLEQYVGTPGAGIADAKVIARDAVSFDSLGRPMMRHVPFVAPASDLTTYDPPPAGTAGELLAYDSLDRVVRTTHPDQSYSGADYTIAGQMAAFDENYNECHTPTGKIASCPGAKRIEYHDALGRAASSELYEGDTLKTTTLTEYDVLGRVLDTKLAAAGSPNPPATTSFEYDSLGRRTKMIDPDAGLLGWTYTYDIGGNLIYENDPKLNQHIELCYDKLNRVSRKWYASVDDQITPIGSKCPPAAIAEPHLDYTYDCEQNRIGRLCNVQETLVGSTRFTGFNYDLRGRVTNETMTEDIIVNGSTLSGSSGRSYSYDAADRLVQVPYPTDSPTVGESLQYSYNDLGQLDVISSSNQTYATYLQYDVFGRLVEWVDGSSTSHRAAYGGATESFRLSNLTSLPQATAAQLSFNYSTYDVGGNLRQLDDVTSYGTPPALTNTWAYGYDGLARLTCAQPGGTGGSCVQNTTNRFTYDNLGNMLANGSLGFTPDASKPHHIGSSTTPGSSSPYQYDDNGALAGRPDTDGTAADTAKTIEYDRDGRVKKVITGDGHTVESVYDFRGERVVRIVDAGLPAQAVTFFYGKWFEVTGNQLTRNFYLGNRLIAISKMNAPAGLTLASVVDPARRIEVARAYDEALGRGLYPEVHLTGHAAVAVGATLLLLCIGLGVSPGLTRVAVVGRMRRGRVGVVIVFFVVTLTPLPLARPAWGGCNNCGTPVPPPPRYPVFFVHGDHLGSTMMLTCRSQPTSVGCADGSVYRYFRYDAYGRMSAYDGARNPVARGNEVAERLYTGQRWDWQGQVYYYHARFYDPPTGRFLSRDPVPTFPSPYAYVAGNPIRFVDPTGAFPTNQDIALTLAILGGAVGAVGALFVLGPTPVGGAFALAFVAATFGAAAAAAGNGSAGQIGTSFFAAFAGGLVAAPLTSFLSGALQLGSLGTIAFGNALSGGVGAGIGSSLSRGSPGDVATSALIGASLSATAAYAAGLLVAGTGLAEATPFLADVASGASAIVFSFVRGDSGGDTGTLSVGGELGGLGGLGALGGLDFRSPYGPGGGGSGAGGASAAGSSAGGGSGEAGGAGASKDAGGGLWQTHEIDSPPADSKDFNFGFTIHF